MRPGQGAPSLFMGLPPTALIVVHVGAGQHQRDKEAKYNGVCDDACIRAMTALRSGSSALEACRIAIEVLEDNPVTNAGRGSSLTRNGFVECDAGLMDGASGLFGGIGAVRGIRGRESWLLT